MISKNYLRLTYLYIILSSIGIILLSAFQIQYQFYIWEFYIDLKIVGIVIFMIFVVVRNKLEVSWKAMEIFGPNWMNMAVWFFVPLGMAMIVIFIGMMTSLLQYNVLDNPITLVLQTGFDIPAFFIFSTTTILIEEVIFRSILQTSISQNSHKISAVLTTSLFWTIFSLPFYFVSLTNSLDLFFSLSFFIFSIGILLSVLKIKYNCLWYGYSLRIAFVSIIPLFLSSSLIETDAFFVNKSLIFSSDGIFFSFLLILLSIYVYRKKPI